MLLLLLLLRGRFDTPSRACVFVVVRSGGSGSNKARSSSSSRSGSDKANRKAKSSRPSRQPSKTPGQEPSCTLSAKTARNG